MDDEVRGLRRAACAALCAHAASLCATMYTLAYVVAGLRSAVRLSLCADAGLAGLLCAAGALLAMMVRLLRLRCCLSAAEYVPAHGVVAPSSYVRFCIGLAAQAAIFLALGVFLRTEAHGACASRTLASAALRLATLYCAACACTSLALLAVAREWVRRMEARAAGSPTAHRASAV